MKVLASLLTAVTIGGATTALNVWRNQGIVFTRLEAIREDISDLKVQNAEILKRLSTHTAARPRGSIGSGG